MLALASGFGGSSDHIYDTYFSEINNNHAVVVLCHLMSCMTGAEVSMALRISPFLQNVKILICSGSPEATIRVAFMQYDAYLAKPAQCLLLLQAIALGHCRVVVKIEGIRW